MQSEDEAPHYCPLSTVNFQLNAPTCHTERRRSIQSGTEASTKQIQLLIQS